MLLALEHSYLCPVSYRNFYLKGSLQPHFPRPTGLRRAGGLAAVQPHVASSGSLTVHLLFGTVLTNKREVKIEPGLLLLQRFGLLEIASAKSSLLGAVKRRGWGHILARRLRLERWEGLLWRLWQGDERPPAAVLVTALLRGG